MMVNTLLFDSGRVFSSPYWWLRDLEIVSFSYLFHSETEGLLKRHSLRDVLSKLTTRHPRFTKDANNYNYKTVLRSVKMCMLSIHYETLIIK